MAREAIQRSLTNGYRRIIQLLRLGDRADRQLVRGDRDIADVVRRDRPDLVLLAAQIVVSLELEA